MCRISTPAAYILFVPSITLTNPPLSRFPPTSPNLQVVVGIIFSIINTCFGLTLVFAYTADTRKTLYQIEPIDGDWGNPRRNDSLAKEMGSEILKQEMEWKSQVQHLLAMEEGKKRDSVKK